MYKITIWAVIGALFFMLASCADDSDDPEEFTNGLMVSIGVNPANGEGVPVDFTARRYVQCVWEVYPGGAHIYKFSAQTSSDETWRVEFEWDPDDADSIVYITDSGYNLIKLESNEVGDYYIDQNKDNADKTFIHILEIDPEEPNQIIKAEFEGFIYETGAPAEPDTLKNGYLVTKNFELPK